MESNKNYNVLRLVLHGNKCYVSSDLIRGKPIIYWLKYHPTISKGQLYSLLTEIISNLEAFHKCRGGPNYQYVNPYSMIVGDDMKIYLLDLGNKSNEEMLHLMQRRMVREHFLSSENLYYQKSNEIEDIYSLGKTIQYIISNATIEPKLSKFEERKLRNIISKCLNKKSKKSFQTIQEISEKFPKKTKEYWHTPKIKRRTIIECVIFCLMFAGHIALFSELEKEKEVVRVLKNKPPVIETKVEIQERNWSETEKMAIYEAALYQLIKYKNYPESIELLQLLKEEKVAENYIALLDQMKHRTWDENKIYDSLKSLEKQKEQIKTKLHELALVEMYEFFEIKNSDSEMQRLYKKCLYEFDMASVPLWKECRYDVKFRIALLEAQCGDTSVSREICAQTVDQMIKELPELKNSKEFKTIQEKYEIIFEEGKTWVKK